MLKLELKERESYSMKKVLYTFFGFVYRFVFFPFNNNSLFISPNMGL